MTDTVVEQHQVSFYVDEGYIPADDMPYSRQRTKHKLKQDPVQLNESLMQDLSMLHEERQHLVVKIDQLEDELHTVNLKNEALDLEIQELQKVTESGQEMEMAIGRISKLTSELEQVTSSGQGEKRLGAWTLEDELKRLTKAVAAAKQEILNSTRLLDQTVKDEKKKTDGVDDQIREKLHKLNKEVVTEVPGLDASPDTDAYNTLRFSVLKLLEAFKEKQKLVSRLEDQLTAANDNKKAMERRTSMSIEATKSSREEVIRTKQRITELTDALEQKESRVLQLQKQLDDTRRKLRKEEGVVLDLKVPVLVVSTSLAAVGVCVYLVYKRQ